MAVRAQLEVLRELGWDLNAPSPHAALEEMITVLSEKAAMHDGDLHTVALVRDQTELTVFVDGGAETKLTLAELEALHLEWSSFKLSSL